MAEPQKSVREMISSPGFFEQPEESQIRALVGANPKFKSAPHEVQVGVLRSLQAVANHPSVSNKPPEPSIRSSFEKGMYEGPAKLDHFAANMLSLMGLKGASEYYRNREKESLAAAGKLPKSSTVGQSIAEAIPNIGIGSIPAIASRSPLALGAVGAIEASDKGVGPAIQGGMENFFYGKAMPMVGKVANKVLGPTVGKYGRHVIVGAIPGFEDLLRQKPLNEAIADAATMAAISVVHGKADVERAKKAATKAESVKSERSPAPVPTGEPGERAANPELIKRIEGARSNLTDSQSRLMDSKRIKEEGGKLSKPISGPIPKTEAEINQEIEKLVRQSVQLEDSGQKVPDSITSRINQLNAARMKPEVAASRFSKSSADKASAERKASTELPAGAEGYQVPGPKAPEPEPIPTTEADRQRRLREAEERAKTPRVVPGLGQRLAPEEVGEFGPQAKPRKSPLGPPREEPRVGNKPTGTALAKPAGDTQYRAERSITSKIPQGSKFTIEKGATGNLIANVVGADGKITRVDLPFRDTPGNLESKGWIKAVGSIPKPEVAPQPAPKPPPPEIPKAIAPPPGVTSKPGSSTTPPKPPPAIKYITLPEQAKPAPVVKQESVKPPAKAVDVKPTEKPKESKPTPVRPPVAPVPKLEVKAEPKPAIKSEGKATPPVPLSSIPTWKEIPAPKKNDIARSALEALGNADPGEKEISLMKREITGAAASGSKLHDVLVDFGIDKSTAADILREHGNPKPAAVEASNIGQGIDPDAFVKKVNDVINNVIKPNDWEEVRVKIFDKTGDHIATFNVDAENFNLKYLSDRISQNPGSDLIGLSALSDGRVVNKPSLTFTLPRIKSKPPDIASKE